MDQDGVRWETYDGGRVALRPSEVHLWSIDLDQERPNLEAMERNLSSGEMERSRRFRYDRDREQFILSHGILREVLGIYLGADPKDLPISYDSRGKPEIAGGREKTKLSFNLSHSEGMVLIATAMNRDLGVDVEHAEPDFPLLEVARRFFTGQEAEFVASTIGPERTEAFFRIWTRREAYLKATGEGLGSQSGGIPFFGGGTSSTTVHIFKNEREWTSFDIKLDGDYFGALVAEGRDLGLRLFRWHLVRPK
jgi:4'-phosphopantetheinyl transferase